MAEPITPPSAGELSRETEEAGFYHEAGLNAAWTASRLAVGGLCFLFGTFVFAYFYLRSVNSSGRWLGSGYHPPSMLMGSIIMAAVVLSAGIQYAALQQIKAGNKGLWQIGGLTALVLGIGAVVLQIIELLFLPFWPGSSGFASVFTGFYPVFLTVLLAAMIWLETLLARSRFIPTISFVEQPPTYTEAFTVQRFQASLSGFTVVWNFLAVMAVLFWFLFYVIPR
jgi:heme/copper-type cytochrome/quinol oxidase subunit 3